MTDVKPILNLDARYDSFTERMRKSGATDDNIADYLSTWTAAGLIGAAIEERYGYGVAHSHPPTNPGENLVIGNITIMEQGLHYVRADQSRHERLALAIEGID